MYVKVCSVRLPILKRQLLFPGLDPAAEFNIASPNINNGDDAPRLTAALDYEMSTWSQSYLIAIAQINQIEE